MVWRPEDVALMGAARMGTATIRSFLGREGVQAAELTVQPISTGVVSRSGRVVVCCPPGYWRRGNLEVACERYGVPLVSTLPELVAEVRGRVAGGPTGG